VCLHCLRAKSDIWIIYDYFRPDGAVQPYQTYPRCSRILAGKGKVAEWLSAKIEEVLAEVLVFPVDPDPCAVAGCAREAYPLETCRDHRCPHCW
jgi:hypothetical protein